VRQVWLSHGGVAAAIAVTHRRMPAERLYNTRGGWWSRTAVFGVYPTALAAIATLPLSRRRCAALLALPLCASVALPGMVDEEALDVRPRNAPALAGVALALAAANMSAATPPPSRRERLAQAALLALATPWLLAEAGLQTRGMAAPSPAEPGVDRVHVGHHEGLDGVLLALDGMALGRAPRSRLHAAYLALMTSYGVAVATQDAWNEQLAKRGLVPGRLPPVHRPAANRGWAAIGAGTLLAYRIFTQKLPSETRNMR
jgi:hypothetical protein